MANMDTFIKVIELVYNGSDYLHMDTYINIANIQSFRKTNVADTECETAQTIIYMVSGIKLFVLNEPSEIASNLYVRYM